MQYETMRVRMLYLAIMFIENPIRYRLIHQPAASSLSRGGRATNPGCSCVESVK